MDCTAEIRVTKEGGASRLSLFAFQSQSHLSLCASMSARINCLMNFATFGCFSKYSRSSGSVLRFKSTVNRRMVFFMYLSCGAFFSFSVMMFLFLHPRVADRAALLVVGTLTCKVFVHIFTDKVFKIFLIIVANTFSVQQRPNQPVHCMQPFHRFRTSPDNDFKPICSWIRKGSILHIFHDQFPFCGLYRQPCRHSLNVRWSICSIHRVIQIIKRILYAAYCKFQVVSSFLHCLPTFTFLNTFREAVQSVLLFVLQRFNFMHQFIKPFANMLDGLTSGIVHDYILLDISVIIVYNHLGSGGCTRRPQT
nr:MAG TPA: hypothetical protein [Caudoviricetes sp.]